MQLRPFITLALAASTVAISGCNPVLRTHGYVATADAKPQAVEPGSDTKSSVLARLGNPSVEGTFDDDLETDTWYYMNQVGRELSVLEQIFGSVGRLPTSTLGGNQPIPGGGGGPGGGRR